MRLVFCENLRCFAGRFGEIMPTSILLFFVSTFLEAIIIEFYVQLNSSTRVALSVIKSA